MPVLVMLGVLTAAGLLLVRGGQADGDLPARIVAAATAWLPARQRDWGHATASTRRPRPDGGNSATRSAPAANRHRPARP